HHISTLFPYTTLFRSNCNSLTNLESVNAGDPPILNEGKIPDVSYIGDVYTLLKKNHLDYISKLERRYRSLVHELQLSVADADELDRKSTRLNSSHVAI